MGDTGVMVGELLALCLQRITMEEHTLTAEFELVEVVKNFEAARKKWHHAELEMKKYKELLVKSDVARAGLEVQLKHARNQVDVEIKKRYKVEGDYQYLQRQMQLMCDILVHDSKSSACLNDEQKSLLANFDHKGANLTLHKSSKRLCVIDESSFLSHSDISYDRTDDDVDLDTTVIKPLRSRAREKRRSSMGPTFGGPTGKRGRVGNNSGDLLERKTVEKEVETIVKASVSTAENGGQIHMVIGITQETPEKASRTVTQECLVSVGEQTSMWAPADETRATPDTAEETTAEVNVRPVYTPVVEKPRKHVFLSKTVIRPETCLPCGKRIRFGKMAVKCRDCRIAAHPECKQKCVEVCSPTTPGAPVQADTLESFAPVTPPRVPLLIVRCVTEIERRGLQERGIYRVPGGERLVKELREKYIQGKGVPMLSKVDDIHVICGLLKDFFRKLKEPLITFRLHRAFMQAAEIPDENNSAAIMYQVIQDLPTTNRDTLAFLMLHLQKVMKSPQCQMDKTNLARVFGPTIVGHGLAEPCPMTIMRDTNTQPKVVSCMLSLPDEYWKHVLAAQKDQGPSTKKANNQDAGHDRLFKPLTSPELSSYYKAPPRGSLRGRMKNLGNAFNNAAKADAEPGKRFFTSPS
ncbi:rac GTPase-activating protein 1 [Diretmus argenteus]